MPVATTRGGRRWDSTRLQTMKSPSATTAPKTSRLPRTGCAPRPVVKAARGRYSAAFNSPIEVTGLYWHFVDVIWIFLFPLLYLLGGHAVGGPASGGR